MQSDIWYDLVLRELSGGGDATKDLLKDAETAQTGQPAPVAEDDPAEDDAAAK